MVAVAHSQRQGFGPPGLRVLGVKGLLAAQALQGRVDPGQQGGVFHSPARNVAAAQHQLALVHLAQLVLAAWRAPWA